MSDTPAVADLLAGAGMTTLGDDPAPDAVAGALRTLAGSLAGADALTREAARSAVVPVLRRHGWRAAAVDAVLAPPRPEDGRQGRALALDDPDPWPDPVDGAELLDELAATVRRYVAGPDGGDIAAALWDVHTHAHDASVISPILALLSPERRSGKTTLLTLLSALVRRPLGTSSISAAALYRAIEAWTPTLLIDEADTVFGARGRGGPSESAEALRGLLNCGHTRTAAYVVRCDGEDLAPRIWGVYAPRAVALIGELPATLADRSITLPMRRRAAGERVDRLRLDRLDEMEPMRRRAWRWAQDHLDALRAHDPDMPRELHDRAADSWRPLLAIADVAGGAWPDRARSAARVLSGVLPAGDDDIGPMLLGDLRELYDGAERMATADVLAGLVAIGDGRPWAEWRDGRPITGRGLARLLARYDIRPTMWRDGAAGGIRGYVTDGPLGDAWTRYAPTSCPYPSPEALHPLPPAQPAVTTSDSGPDPSATAADTVAHGRRRNSRSDTEVAHVAGAEGGMGSDGIGCPDCGATTERGIRCARCTYTAGRRATT